MNWNDKIDVNEGLWELCKYQHNLIEQYKNFIEKTILVKILENYTPAKYSDQDWLCQELTLHEVRIPETRFMNLMSPRIQRSWQMLTWDTPVVKPDVYLKLMHRAAEEQEKNAETN